ncbi:MAG: glutamate 5-kinase [Bdellovibrionales bacterium]|nr:glutamate 5-kinase [Bdellovibrionales bacterium]
MATHSPTPYLISSREHLPRVKRIIVKVGSAVLTREKHNTFSLLASQIAALHSQGIEVVLVSSGAIALGYRKLGFAERPRSLSELQASAALGQTELMRKWQEAFEGSNVQTAQILVTHSDLASRRRYINARNTIETLLSKDVLPILNENDTVSVEEIRLGDNDLLAAEIAGLCSAPLLVLLTEVDGLYTANPFKDERASRLSVVPCVTEDIKEYASGASKDGSGGMLTKILSAERAHHHGVATIIASGLASGTLEQICKGDEIGTFFCSSESSPQSARKRWIRSIAHRSSCIRVDRGAENALRKGASLLLVGVTEIEGEFRVGDAIRICGESGLEIGTGLVSLDSQEARKFAGLRREEILSRFDGGILPETFVHRDDLIVEKTTLADNSDRLEQ